MQCGGCFLGRQPEVVGEGPKNAKLMLIGEAPGADEARLKRPFVGQAGKLLDFLFDKLGLDRGGIFITNCFKCRPPQNKLPSKGKLMPCWQACQPLLQQELEYACPKVVVLLGETALSLVGERHKISLWAGRHWGEKPVTYASFHPAYVLRRPSYESRLAHTLAGAASVAGLKVEPRTSEHWFEYEIAE